MKLKFGKFVPLKGDEVTVTMVATRKDIPELSRMMMFEGEIECHEFQEEEGGCQYDPLDFISDRLDEMIQMIADIKAKKQTAKVMGHVDTLMTALKKEVEG